MTDIPVMEKPDGFGKRVIVVALLTLLGIIGVLYFTAWNTRDFERNIISQSQRHLLTIAREEASRMKSEFQRIQVELEVIVSVPALMNMMLKQGVRERAAEQGFDINHYLKTNLGDLVSVLYCLAPDGSVHSAFPLEASREELPVFSDQGLFHVMESRKSHIDDLTDDDSGLKAICVSVPVVRGEYLVGVLRAIAPLNVIEETLSGVQAGEKGYVLIVDDGGELLSHPDARQVGKNMMAFRKEKYPDRDWSDLEAIVKKMVRGEEGVESYQSVWWTEKNSGFVDKMTSFSPVRLGEEIWSVGVVMGYDEIAGPIRLHTRNTQMIAGFLVLIFLAGGIFLYIALRKRDELLLFARSAKALLEINQNLEEEIAERKRLMEKLIRSERLAALGRLAASVAHEVNSPLQAVNCILGGMKRHDDPPEKRASNISLIQTALRDVAKTVNNLLDLNRPGKSKKQPVDVNAAVKDSAALSRSYLIRNRVHLSLRLSPEMPKIFASPQELNQVLINLVNNAVEAITGARTDKEDRQTHGEPTDKITIGTEMSNGSAVISVADTGPGISEENMMRVFDPFFTWKRKPGMGIGLSVCQNIVENHKGTIEARNAPEGGTVFEISLPTG